MNRRNNLRTLLLLLANLTCIVPASAAESSAQTGPVQLTLRVHKTTLQLLDEVDTDLDYKNLMLDYKNIEKKALTGPNHDEVDESKFDYAALDQSHRKNTRSIRVKMSEPIWVQIEVKNIGRVPIIENDPIFDAHSDFGTSLQTNIGNSDGTFITVIGPDGKKVEWTAPPMMIDGCEPFRELSTYPPLIGEEKRRVDAITKAGREEGLSADQVQKRLDAYSSEKGERDRKSAPERTRKRLEPGQSLTTPTWVYGGVCGDRKPLPAPVAGFAELWNYKLTKPGRYRIRAVYDNRAPRTWDKARRELHLKRAPGAVRAVTPDIVLEVKP